MPDNTRLARILLVEDDPAHLSILTALLGKLPMKIETAIATSTAEAKAIFARQALDLVLVDVVLPDASGLEIIQKMSGERGTPVIVVTGAGSERIAVEAMKRGAWDYLRKDQHLAAELPRAVTEALDRNRARTRRRTEELEKLAFTDSLTGLHNRRYFDESFVREFAAARRYGQALSLILVDLDHFKNVNDTWGHPVGDRVLADAAAALRAAVRTSDLVSRYGGEEMACLLPSTPTDGALILGERLLDSLRQLRFDTDGKSFTVSGSAGLATSSAEAPYPSPARLFEAADRALYRAKQAGRDRLVVADPSEPPAEEATAPLRLPT